MAPQTLRKVGTNLAAAPEASEITRPTEVHKDEGPVPKPNLDGRRSTSPHKPTAHLRGGIRVVEAYPAKDNPKGRLETYLRVPLNLNMGGERLRVLAPVDTGAEVNLIRTGLVPPNNSRRQHDR